MSSYDSSSFVRSKRCLLLIDHRDADLPSIADAIRAEGFRPHTLPSLTRAQVHLAGPDAFEGLVLPAELGEDTIAAFLEAARAQRPGLPVVVVASEAGQPPPEDPAERRGSPAIFVVRTASGFEPNLGSILGGETSATAPSSDAGRPNAGGAA